MAAAAIDADYARSQDRHDVFRRSVGRGAERVLGLGELRTTERSLRMPDKDVVREPGQGKVVWLLGGLYEIKVAGSETGGALTVVEITAPAGMGPPPHNHTGDETLYVLDG